MTLNLLLIVAAMSTFLTLLRRQELIFRTHAVPVLVHPVRAKS
jgi:hypothetical protein